MKNEKIAPYRIILIISGLCWFLLVQSAIAQTFSPPPQPDVAPLISETYSNDMDNDRIDDGLLVKTEAARDLASTAATAETSEEKIRAEEQIEEMVKIELIFNQQITQRQIDDFLALGGEITYIYKAVSYGWNGRIPPDKVEELPAEMGATLVLVDEPKLAVLHMDRATQTGRVRPIWAADFAGNASGFDGDSTITIAILDTGVDGSHPDLNGAGTCTGRCVYWNDFTSDSEPDPFDEYQHGSHVAGVALGTGAAGGSATATLYYTDKGDLTSVSNDSFVPSPLYLSRTYVTFESIATWTGGGSTDLKLVSHTEGASGSWTSKSTVSGTSPQTVSKSFSADSSRAYSAALLSDGGTVQDYVITNSVTNYPEVGDGFNKFSGVAPGANWAGAKVFTNTGSGNMSDVGSAIDDLVTNRETYNIKIMNLSLGVDGSPGINVSSRQKVNTAVNNGIVMVISAGNDGSESSATAREVDDPGRAAMALTVAASNDANAVTYYTSEGFDTLDSTSGQEEDYKPDITAPGGSSSYYTSIMSVDSNSGDGSEFSDQQADDYYNIQGTSMAAPFVAGSAALVIDAMQQQGATWDFYSDQHSSYVKMVLCATASETNSNRENSSNNPTLQRAANGPGSFPAGKDPYEGYGMINPDAAVEAVSQTYTIGSTAIETFGSGATDRRVWARTVSLTANETFDPTLINPTAGDFDLYLYSATPDSYGTPTILASSTNSGNSTNDSISYTPGSSGDALIIVKRISGSGTFVLTPSDNITAGPFYVDDGQADDDGDGLSWAAAKKTITTALAVANGNGEATDEVCVKGGTYDAANGEKFPLEPVAGRSLIGEAASDTTKDTYCTDGGSSSFASGTSTITGDNSTALINYFSNGTDSTTFIDGFTVTNTNASGQGIQVKASETAGDVVSPTISNNTITGNSGNGVFIYARNTSGTASPTLSNNTITGNDGVGVYINAYSSNSVASPTINNNTITGNTGSGVVIYATYGTASPTLTNNTITGNAGVSGGVYIWPLSGLASPTFSNNTITGNKRDGVVIYVTTAGIANVDMGTDGTNTGHNTIKDNDDTNLDGTGYYSGSYFDVGNTGGTVTAENNWWGASPPVDSTHTSGITIATDATPYNAQALTFTVSPSNGGTGGGTVITITASSTAPRTYFVDDVGATPDNISVTIDGNGATSVSVSTDGTTITATTPAGSLNAVADVVVTNPAGQTGTLSSAFTYDTDTTAPTVSITSSASDPTNSSPFSVTITFNEDVTGFVVGDITVSNGSAGAFTETTANQIWTADITPTSDGAVTVDVASGVALDSASNNNTAATQLSRTYDGTAPTAPTVSGTTPTTDTTPTWSWSSGGDGNGTFRYELNDSDLTSGATETTSASYTPASALSDGSYTLYVQERDDAGNWSSSGSFTIVIDTTTTTTTSSTTTIPTTTTTSSTTTIPTPTPDIKANGSDGPITITTNDPLTIVVSLSSGTSAGQNADWWVAADTSFAGWYYYNLTGGWLPGLVVTRQGPLSDLSPYAVLNGATGLAVGNYTIYFGVDLTMDGAVSNPLYYDSVMVIVVP